MTDMDAYRDVFLSESTDFIQQITDGLLALESDPGDAEPVEVVFRGSHSLKGMAAAMTYNRTAELTHKMEDLMSKVRSGDLKVSRQVIDTMLAAVDLLRDLIDDESNGKSEIDTSEMIGQLMAMAEGKAAAPPETPIEPAVAGSGQPSSADSITGEIAEGAGAEPVVGATVYRAKVTLEDACVLKAVRAYMVIKRYAHMGRVVDTEPSGREIEDEMFGRDFVVILETPGSAEDVRRAAMAVSEVESVEVTAAKQRAAEPRVAAPEPGAPARRQEVPKLSETQTVRVSIGHLDELVNLVGELVILRSRLDGLVPRVRDIELSETVEEMHRITQDLQFEVLQTRMVPVGNIFNRFPRMVRDLAHELGKQVDFQMTGLDIELDRTVLDEIGDPIVHLLRNAVDHGIESAEKRTAAGKPADGTVTLGAWRERDHVSITVTDDGGGIDADRIWSKALERGLVRPEQRAEYTTTDILMLTCLPGFSTAEHATKVSGRGVGMDVVKGKIEHLGGTLRITSNVGSGTEFELRLPLTLAIVRSLMVAAGGQTFALPLSSVNEVFDAEEIAVDTVDGAPVVLLRDGTVVSLERLDAILFGADPHAPLEPRSSVVLVDAAGEQRALHVDALVSRQEIVVKPLTALFRDSRGFAGATILGDGRVVLILDPRTLFTISEGAR